jgi:hypothetical protein
MSKFGLCKLVITNSDNDELDSHNNEPPPRPALGSTASDMLLEGSDHD